VSGAAGKLLRRLDQVEDALLLRDPADEQHVGLGDAVLLERRLVGRLHVDVRVDPVVDDDDLLRIGVVVLEDVVAHEVRHRDHAVGRLDDGLLDPRGDVVARAELVALPGAERLHGVERHDERDLVQHADPHRAHVRVPRVRVDHVRVDVVPRRGESDRERLQRTGEAGAVLALPHAVPRAVAPNRHVLLDRRPVLRVPLVPRPDLDLDPPFQRLREFGDDDSGAAVDVRGVLPRDL
jgi:hypothetical protein